MYNRSIWTVRIRGGGGQKQYNWYTIEPPRKYPPSTITNYVIPGYGTITYADWWDLHAVKSKFVFFAFSSLRIIPLTAWKFQRLHACAAHVRLLFWNYIVINAFCRRAFFDCMSALKICTNFLKLQTKNLKIPTNFKFYLHKSSHLNI